MTLRIDCRLFRLLALAGVLALSACATPTPYQPLTDGEGYSEQSLETDRYRVMFAGNSLTPRATVENYLLYRAAEVTLARGFDYFIVVEKQTDRATTYHAIGTTFGGGTYPYGYDDFTGLGVFGSATATPSNSYVAFANILLRKGKKDPKDTAAYDARDVLDRLKPTIIRKPAT